MANYKIEDIEGIGPANAKKLRRCGVRTVSALLRTGTDRKGRQTLAAESGITDSTILTWVNIADLYRIDGIGRQYSELLVKAGVDTVKELAQRNPDNLLAKMQEVNSKGRALVKQLPGLKTVEGWVKKAKKLDRKVFH